MQFDSKDMEIIANILSTSGLKERNLDELINFFAICAEKNNLQFDRQRFYDAVRTGFLYSQDEKMLGEIAGKTYSKNIKKKKKLAL